MLQARKVAGSNPALGTFMKTKIVFSEKCLEYGLGHLESPNRVFEAYEVLRRKGYEFVRPEPASEKDVLKVHSKEYLEVLKKGLEEDPDTPAYENIYYYALLSAGAAILAAENGWFSLMRPPGHHAGRNGKALGAATKGFCYLNNIAIAVKHLDKQTLIIDIDGHHGNGTQEIFFKDPKVTYVSLHRHPYYPGTGYKTEENCINFPLRAECGDATYLEAFDKALKSVDAKKVEVVAVSAGFDAHRGDLASLGLTENCYREVGKRIGRLEKHTFFVLEGGYNGYTVGKCIDELLEGFNETFNV